MVACVFRRSVSTPVGMRCRSSLRHRAKSREWPNRKSRPHRTLARVYSGSSFSRECRHYVRALPLWLHYIYVYHCRSLPLTQLFACRDCQQLLSPIQVFNYPTSAVSNMSDPNNPNIKLRTTLQWSLYQRENFWQTNEGKSALFDTCELTLYIAEFWSM